MTATAVTAVERKSGLDEGPHWPNVVEDAPQWPNVKLDEPPFVTTPLRPDAGFALPALDTDIVASAGPRWPTMAPEPRPSPFSFEIGARYWYSGGHMRFAFSNGAPGYGSPTSTLDWRGMTAHSGEVFARLDHKPSGMFVKAVVGMGGITDGRIDDRDFLVNQFKFSDTTSEVTGSRFDFATIDVGWSFSPTRETRFGAFVGYHYWREKATANGLYCNQALLVFVGFCPTAGTLDPGYDTPVFVYEPTWHAVRLGVEGKISFLERWSVSGEVAAVPWATVTNKDSHLLRQSTADLGPAPNIVSRSWSGFGVQAEMFVNYAITPNIEIGAGLRYWQFVTYTGNVNFGPAFTGTYQLDQFDQARYGVLVHVKGRF